MAIGAGVAVVVAAGVSGFGVLIYLLRRQSKQKQTRVLNADSYDDGMQGKSEPSQSQEPQEIDSYAALPELQAQKQAHEMDAK